MLTVFFKGFEKVQMHFSTNHFPKKPYIRPGCRTGPSENLKTSVLEEPGYAGVKEQQDNRDRGKYFPRGCFLGIPYREIHFS